MVAKGRHRVGLVLIELQQYLEGVWQCRLEAPSANKSVRPGYETYLPGTGRCLPDPGADQDTSRLQSHHPIPRVRHGLLYVG